MHNTALMAAFAKAGITKDMFEEKSLPILREAEKRNVTLTFEELVELMKAPASPRERYSKRYPMRTIKSGNVLTIKIGR